MSKYKPYPKYKDSGVKKLGLVPEEWQVARIKNIAKLNPSRTELRGTAKDLPVSFLPMETIGEDGTLDLTKTVTVEDAQTGYTYIAENDVFIAKITPCFENGKGAVARGLLNKIAFATTEIIPLRPQKHCDSQFLFYLLSTHVFRKTAEGEMYGAGGQKRVPDSFVANYKLAVPDVQTQKAIVSFVNSELSHIDTIIKKQKHLINLLEEKRISIISHAVTNGICTDNLLPTDNAWIWSIPVGWNILPARRLFSYITSGSRGWAQYYADSGDIFLRIGNLMRTSIDLDLADLQHVTPPTNSEGERTKIRDGDILISITADLGSIALAPSNIDKAYVSQHIALCRPNENLVTSSRWLAYALFSAASKAQFSALAYGGTKIQLSLDDIRNINIVVPSLDEQERIATYLDRELSKIDAIISKTRQAIALAQERRAAIISAAVTGKICVSRPQSAKKPLSKSLEYFQKVVLAAEITDQLHTERTFGRVKLQKILYLSEYHAQLPFQRSEYQRYAAGPHDPKAMYSIEGQMKKQKWFDSRLRESGYGKEYVPLERHEAYKRYYERYFAEKHEVIQRLIDLLRPKDTQFCEVVATLYGVWNDFLLEGQQPDDAAMFKEAVTNWAPEKKKVPSGLWPKALHWMRENNLVPCGWGEPTIHRQEA